MDTSILFNNLFNFKEVKFFLAWESLLLVFLAFFLLWLGKKSIGIFQRSFSVENELFEKDNPALAVSFAGYLISIGIILYYLISSPPSSYWSNWEGLNPQFIPALDITVWFIFSILLLNVSRVINDKFLLYQFSNRKEIIEDQNIGAGVVQMGSYISSAYMISMIIAYGQEKTLLLEIIFALLYFSLSQIGLIVFSRIYARLLPYRIHDEIEKDNFAPGVSFGLTLIAIGMIISFPLQETGNLVVLFFWFINGVVLLFISRLLLNLFFFKKKTLDYEIEKDQNWGIALIEGSIMIIIALIMKSSFA